MANRSSKTSQTVQSRCFHKALHFEPSLHAAEVGYEQPSSKERIIAATLNGVTANEKGPENLTLKNLLPSSFPAPLVLPGKVPGLFHRNLCLTNRCSSDDDLAYDPEYEPQSLTSWAEEEERNEVTKKRKTVYVIASPDIDPEIDFVRKWASPRIGKGRNVAAEPTPSPKLEDVIAYLRAFYTGMTVKALPTQYQFATWDSPPAKPSRQKRNDSTPYIGLTTSSSTVRIRTRPTPSTTGTFTPFTHQLNLNDLLDALIEDLPADAYATILLVAHDIYEGDDDDFCMGRAYGGSRIAVVSMGRYDPGLDRAQRIDSEHGWPASHCEDFVSKQVEEHGERGRGPARKKAKKGSVELSVRKKSAEEKGENGKVTSPMGAAVEAYRLQYKDVSACESEELQEIWLGRICRTVSHELGHCFGMDHCVYYACNMQSTASLVEDGRQPPYLCPVDLAKLQHATGRTTNERFEALHEFCKRHAQNALFAAFGEWLSASIGNS